MTDTVTSERTEREFHSLLDYLEQTRGFDFSAYKRASLMRRVSKRMQMVGQESFAEYKDYLEVHPEEFGLLFNTILINVTSFFRDPPTWEYLSKDIVPKILADKRDVDPVRVWSAGCASGEEVYTLAILLTEAMGVEAFRRRVKIYATDVDDEALSRARLASYEPGQVEGVSSELLNKYFDVVNSNYVFNKELRRQVIFGRHDLLHDAPIPHVDLLVCRNTLMYFNAEAQTRILARFDFAINPSGYLFLGKAEMMAGRASAFVPVELKQRVFRKVPNQRHREMAYLGQSAARQDGGYGNGAATTDNNRLSSIAMETDPIAQIIADSNGVLVLASEAARQLLNLSVSDLGKSINELEFTNRPIDMRAVIALVYAERRDRTLRDVEWPTSIGDRRFVDIMLLPLTDEMGAQMGIRITFADVTRVKQLQEELQHSRQELETANEELQSSNEELETTNEELQSTVEELETTNEELQSTNEELETMNEELQSTNEELETTNAELRHFSDELNMVNVLLGSILSSIDDGVIVVDRNLLVLAWNKQSEELWGLRSDEVLGKHLMNLDIGLPVEHLVQAIRQCMTGDGHCEIASLEAVNRRGKSIRVKVNCSRLQDTRDTVGGSILMIEELRERETAE